MAWITGELNGSGPFYVGMDVWYSGVQDWGANTSRFDWAVKVGCWNNGWGTFSGSTQYWSCSIGGVGYSGTWTLDFRPSGSSARNYAVGSGSTWHGHDANGYRGGFPSSAYIDSDHSSVGDGGSGDAWVDAPRIPKVPAAPTSVNLDSVTADSFRYQFSGNDDGGSGILEWQIQLATNAGFTTGLQDIASSGTTTITGLANHTNYWVRSRGRNGIGWGPYSSSMTTATLGHPTVPTSVATVPSTSVTGRIQVNWSAPATTGAGGIVGYNIFRDGVQVATTTGTGTGYTDNGLTPYTTYAYRIAARNAYSTSVSATGPQSTAVNGIAPGPPGAPTGLTATPDGLVPGKVDLSWTAPANVGAGGITGYRVRLADGTLVVNQNGTGTTYSVTGLTPGVTYTFKVSARNALSDTEGSEGAFSSSVVVTPIGEPAAPTGLTVTQSATVSNRLTLSWTAPAGVLSGYSIFRQTNGVGAYALIGKINSGFTTFTVDDMPAGTTQNFHVRARTSYTDTLAANAYPGNWGGPATANVGAASTVNNAQTFAAVSAVISGTNAIFNGTYVINQVTSNTIRYAKTAANIVSSASGGTIANNTNAIFNGTFTIAVPTTTTLTYAKTNANIVALATTGGVVSDLTNAAFNGTFTVTAVNVGANTLSYANTAANLAATTVPVNAAPGQSGTVTNLSNAIFNGVGKTITAITEYTMTYAQTNANVAESNAAGTVTDTTNRDYYNGTFTVLSIPAYNIVQYAGSGTIALRTWISPNGILSRATSPSLLDVRFRSGWSG